MKIGGRRLDAKELDAKELDGEGLDGEGLDMVEERQEKTLEKGCTCGVGEGWA